MLQQFNPKNQIKEENLDDSILNLDEALPNQEGTPQDVFSKIINMICENGDQIYSKQSAIQFCEHLGFNFLQLIQLKDFKERQDFAISGMTTKIR